MNLFSADERKLFRACGSLLPAAEHFARAAYGAATISGDLFRRAKAARTSAEYRSVVRKLFPVLYRIDPKLRDKAEAYGSEVIREFDQREAHYLRVTAKREGKSAARREPRQLSAEPLRTKYPIPYLMISNWLRCGSIGDPGFCFYSDRALTDLFSLFVWGSCGVCPEELDSEQMEQMRGRLGLLKAFNRIPWVTGARLNPQTGLIELNTLEAKAAMEKWPRNPLVMRQRIELSGRVLYKGLPA